jgi:hypothetical protein
LIPGILSTETPVTNSDAPSCGGKRVGADVTITNNKNESALHVAARKGREGIARLIIGIEDKETKLLNPQGTVNVSYVTHKNVFKRTPFDEAMMAKKYSTATYLQERENVLSAPRIDRRLIAQEDEPLANLMDEKLPVATETPAIAESSHVPALLLIAFAMFLGYLFFRCVKARRRTARPLAYPVGLLG